MAAPNLSLSVCTLSSDLSLSLSSALCFSITLIVLFKSSSSLDNAAIAPGLAAGAGPGVAGLSGCPAAPILAGEEPPDLPINEARLPGPGDILGSLSFLVRLSAPPAAAAEPPSGELLSEEVLTTLVLFPTPSADKLAGFNESLLACGGFEVELLAEEELEPVRDSAAEFTVDWRRGIPILVVAGGLLGCGGGPMEPGLPLIDPRKFEPGRLMVGVPVRGVL